MNDRIDRYLDGTLEQVALGSEERVEAEIVERAIEDTRAFVEARRAPDLTSAVMGRIREVGSPPARQRRRGFADAIGALWRPREVAFSFRPVYALAGAAAIAIMVLVFPLSGGAPAPQVAAVDDASTLLVQFRLQAQQASSVRLAGSFTNWQPEHELHQTAPGIWTITLPLPLGVHDYAFVVDGMQWVPDPYAPAVDDGFGGVNSRIALLPPGPPRT